MSDIQFTYEGRQVVIPFADDYTPSAKAFALIKEQHPDAELCLPVDRDLLVTPTPCYGWGAYFIKEPRT